MVIGGSWFGSDPGGESDVVNGGAEADPGEQPHGHQGEVRTRITRLRCPGVAVLDGVIVPAGMETGCIHALAG
jgi:hypothetical protein